MRCRLVLMLVTFAACSHSPGAANSDARPGDGATNADADDGTPAREPCTSSFGDKLSAASTFGRLDGFLVAIVAPAKMQASTTTSPTSICKCA